MARRDLLFIDNAKVLRNTNFKGEERRRNGRVVNDAGSRGFCVIIDDPDEAQRLADDGWKVTIKTGLEDEEGNILPPFSFLPVKIGFQYPPKEIIMETESGVETTLYDVRHRDEDAIGVLDDFDIVYVDLSLSHGKRDENGRWTAYVHQLYAKVEENRWEAKHPRRRDDDYEED